MKNNKQRLFEVMRKVNPDFKPKLNESGAFNDAGEPLMTHNQYRDYSEPSEPDYDDSRNDYEEDQTSKSVVKAIEKHFNTILETYDGESYNFLTKGNVELYINFYNNKVSANAEIDRTGEKEFPEQHVEDLSVDELIQFFEPYRQHILAGAEAEAAMTRIQKQNSDDRRYAAQERGYTGGFGESVNEAGQAINPKYTHFALLKDTSEIVNGWDYSEIEPVELRQFKKDYFFDDLTNMGIDPRNIKVVTTKYLQTSGVNPFDVANWKQDATNEALIKEDNSGFKRMIVFWMYDKEGGYLGDLDPMADEGYISTFDEIAATPEFEKFAKEKNITRDQIGRVTKSREYMMNGNYLEKQHYAPSQSEELFDPQTNTWYNLSGQQMRNPDEYERYSDGTNQWGERYEDDY